jgi:hypothetical protein
MRIIGEKYRADFNDLIGRCVKSCRLDIYVKYAAVAVGRIVDADLPFET